MNAHTKIREQAETLLDLSNSILAAAIGGYWDEMDALEAQRAELFERLLGLGEISGEDQVFLAGVMEHVRVVDSTTQKFIGMEHGVGWLKPAAIRYDAVAAEEFDFLSAELADPGVYPSNARPTVYQ
jgi:hypothetical protein